MEASQSSTCESQRRFLLNRPGRGGSKNSAGIIAITEGGNPGSMTAHFLAATAPVSQGCAARDARCLLLYRRRGGSHRRENTPK
jgi:hypothetical protein